MSSPTIAICPTCPLSSDNKQEVVATICHKSEFIIWLISVKNCVFLSTQFRHLFLPGCQISVGFDWPSPGELFTKIENPIE